MNITKEDWAEAADVLDTAHDVLMVTGVQCASTYEQAGTGHRPEAEANCTWEAIAIAMGAYSYSGMPLWSDVAVRCLNNQPDSMGMWPNNVERAIGWAMNGFTPGHNDKATEDEVFDRIREAAKQARELAHGVDA